MALSVTLFLFLRGQRTYVNLANGELSYTKGEQEGSFVPGYVAETLEFVGYSGYGNTNNRAILTSWSVDYTKKVARGV
jgi:hypothetical protein